MLRLSLVFLFVFNFTVSASELQFIGKCSWDNTTEDEYRPGHALAEFFLDQDSGIVYVHNFIDQDGGSFRDIPVVPDFDLLQEAGTQGTMNYLWDDGASRIGFEGHPLDKVSRSTNSFNSLGTSGNIYAPCLFIGR